MTNRSSENSPAADPAARGPGGFAGWVLSHPYTVVCAVTLFVMGVGATLKRGSAWDEVPLAAAKLLLRGRDFYKHVPNFTYPPFTALVTVPFTPFSPRLARALWFILSAASLLWMINTAWRVAGGPELEPDVRRGLRGAGRREWVAFILGLVAALQFALNALTHLQSDLLIGALLMIGCAAILAGRWMGAATWIGVAAAFKATPLLFFPYLLWRRRWLAAAWLMCVAVGANLLTDAVHRPPEGGLWLGHWVQKYLEPMAGSSYLPGDWKNQLVNNQSLAGAANRFLTTTWRAEPDDFKVYQRPGRLPTGVVRAAYLAACAAASLPLLWVLWRRRRLDRAAPGRAISPRRYPDPVAVECGMVMLLMLLMSPNSSRAHFAIMILPAFCVARVAVQPGRGRAMTLMRVLFALSLICSTASIHLRVGATYVAEQALLWLGVVSASALFLLLACAVEMQATPVEPESSSSPGTAPATAEAPIATPG